MRISDWSSDVCSSDLRRGLAGLLQPVLQAVAVCIPPVTHFVTLFLRKRHLVVVIGQNVVRTVVHVLVPKNFDQRSPCQEAGTKDKRDLGDTVKDRKSTRLNSSH